MSTDGGEPIRVLHVDDDDGFADLVAIHLEREDESMEVITEHSAEDGLDRLESAAVDCVVSDHDMPMKNGLEFLEDVRERYPELPFILFTGKGSEEIASEAISAGVTEYLQKGMAADQYTLLANRIERAVEETRAKSALEESERMLSTLISNLPGMVYRCRNGAGWPMTFASEGGTDLTGYNPDAIESGDVSWSDDVMVEEDREQVREQVQRAVEAGEPFEVTYRIKTKEGDTRWIWERGRAVDEQPDGTELLEGFMTDITARKQREAELNREREFTTRLIDAIDDAFYVVNLEGEFIRWNNTVTEVTGYDDTEIGSMTAVELFAEEHQSRVLDSGQEILDIGHGTYEADVVTKAGDRIPYEFRGALIRDIDGSDPVICGIGRDITNRQARERKLAQYKTLVENVGDPMYVLAADSTIEMVNQAMANHIGADREEMIGESPAEFATEASVQEANKLIDELLAETGQTWATFEMETVGADGTQTACEAMIAVLTDEEGTYDGSVGVIRDISERSARERRLEQYRQLVQTVADPMYVLKPEGVIEMCNEAMASHLGLDCEDIEGNHALTFMPEDDVRRGRQTIHDLLESPDRSWATYEMRTFGPDGEVTYNENKVAVITDEDGKFQGSVGVMRDISDRKQRKRELERHETIIEAVGDPLYTADADGVLTFVNEAMESLTGYGRGELVGTHIGEVMVAEDVETGAAIIKELLESDSTQYETYEMDLVTADGEQIPCENHLTLLPLEDGEFQGTAGVIRDITERKQREEQLREFASVVSHDLRNPLNVVQGRLDLARDTGELTHLEAAVDAADRMEQLINDLLRLARQGQELDAVQPVDIEEIATGAWELVVTENATLTVEDSMTVQSDPERLRELFENLLGNAVVHGREDDSTPIQIRVGETETGFYVADDGVGIDPADRETVFERGHSTSDEGTGFGLAIVENIVTAHDWEITLRESEDGGARFDIDT
jgi:PAS domain S-box-containing protein